VCIFQSAEPPILYVEEEPRSQMKRRSILFVRFSIVSVQQVEQRGRKGRNTLSTSFSIMVTSNLEAPKVSGILCHPWNGS